METKFLQINVRLVGEDGLFHGQRENNEPEWPPSPLRLYQAIVDAAASRWREGQFTEHAQPLLQWLERLGQPEIVAPPHSVGTPFRIAVPNNDLDVWAGPVSKGSEPKKQPNELKAMKQVRPVHLSSDELHYLYPLPDGNCPHLDVLKSAARSITHLGWGIDMAVGDADVLSAEDVAKLEGVRWNLAQAGGTPLRVPKAGTLEDLIRKHTDFLNRVSAEGFRPVPPLRVFDVVHYRRITAPVPPAWAAFTILKPDASGNRAFNTARKMRHVAGMLRHAVCKLAERQHWDEATINEFIHGKNEKGDAPASGDQSPRRFSYLPLPTISRHQNRVESIRRVLISAPEKSRNEINWIRRALSGVELINEETEEAEGLLTILPASDWILGKYTGQAKVWATVTPVILPGYDDPDGLRRKLRNNQNADVQHRYLSRLENRVDELLRKAFCQAGFSLEFVKQFKLDWRKAGFHPGGGLASHYLPPKNLDDKPRYHVRVEFPQKVNGPIAVGSGRFRGFGLFASIG